MDELEFTPWPDELAKRYRELGLWQGKTFYDYLCDSVRRFPNHTAIICDDREYSYQQMQQEIARLAAGFTELGLTAGDNVVLQMTNHEAFYFCYFALIQKGIRPVMALPAHRKNEITYFCQHANAKAYIIDGEDPMFDYTELAQQVAAECPQLQHVIVKGEMSPLMADLYRYHPAVCCPISPKTPLQIKWHSSSSLAVRQACQR